jgi:type I restriction enzyme M protein
MPDPSSQQFLRDLDKKLWSAADRLRANLDAAVYKHAVLGLIFLKYVSDSFAIRQREIEAQLRDPKSDYYLDPADYGGKGSAKHLEAIRAELEERDYYIEKNVFWVPALARWKTLQDSAPLPPGTEIEVTNGKKVIYKLTSIGKLIDDALDAVEKENPKLKNVLDKRYAQLQLPAESLIGLINLIATIPFEHADLHAKDILGHVYEYFLGQFALAEGKKGGQYFTPKSIVSLIVEMLEPYQGRVYDPAMGSGGFFVQSERFIKEHGGKLGNLSVYGQESNPTTWRLAAMNMAIRGIDFNFGKEPANSFTSDQHPDLRADYVMANPPFNISEWWDAKLEGDPRWRYGTPPRGNANFAWIQHMLHHLAPQGSMALLLANGSMSSGSGGEGQIRQALIEADLVECMVALPGQLFTNTPIPACIWFLTKSKRAHGEYRDRSSQTLFIHASKLGYMIDRVLRAFTMEDLEKIIGTFQKWKRSASDYADFPGFCKSATLAEIATHDFVLTPGRYVGAEDVDDDREPFEERMTKLIADLNEQFAESARLEQTIKANLVELGYGG